MKRTRLQATAFALMLLSQAQAQSPAKMEYFLDTDPGVGEGTVLTGISLGNNALTIDLSAAEPGAHVLFLRCQDELGNWSQTVSRPLFIDQPMGAPAVSRLECFFDDEPGAGEGLPLADVSVGEQTYELPLGGLSAGLHVLHLRALDTRGNWSALVSRPFYVLESAEQIAALEYFFDYADPGCGRATSVSLPSDLSEPSFAFDIELGELPPGDHLLHVRAMNQLGIWSPVATETIEVTADLSGVKTVTSRNTPTCVYDLQGKKVSGQPLRSGGWQPKSILIVNGRKVVVK